MCPSWMWWGKVRRYQIKTKQGSWIESLKVKSEMLQIHFEFSCLTCFLARNIRISLDQSGSYEGREAVATGRFYLWQKLEVNRACKRRQRPDNLAPMLQCLRFLRQDLIWRRATCIKDEQCRLFGGSDRPVLHVTDSRFFRSPSRLFCRGPR